MTAYHLFDTRSDQDRPAEPIPTRSTCAHIWGVARRTGWEPGVIGNLFQRDCKRCRASQVWRGTQGGRLVELVRETA